MTIEVWLLGYAAIACLTVPSFLHFLKSYYANAEGETQAESSKSKVLSGALVFALLWPLLAALVLLIAVFQFFAAPLKKEKKKN